MISYIDMGDGKPSRPEKILKSSNMFDNSSRDGADMHHTQAKGFGAKFWYVGGGNTDGVDFAHRY